MECLNYILSILISLKDQAEEDDEDVEPKPFLVIRHVDWKNVGKVNLKKSCRLEECW